MYDNLSSPLAAGLVSGSAGLAMTGANMFWIILAAFALLALGLAVLRITPHLHTAPNAENYLGEEADQQGRP